MVSALGFASECYWIVDDTGFPKKGECSAGLARKYCGQLGQQDNCQMAVSLSLVRAQGSVPIAYRLYLPEQWARDRVRRKRVGVPVQIQFATKPEIALAQIRQAKEAGVAAGIVLADADDGNDTAFRDALSALGLTYVVGVQSTTTVWAPGTGQSRGPRHTPAQGVLILALADSWQCPLSRANPENSSHKAELWALNTGDTKSDYIEHAARIPTSWLP